MTSLSFTIPGPPHGKGRGHKRVADAVLVEAYGRLGNIHKVGAEVGVGGGSVHERLVRLGAAEPMRLLNAEDRERIRVFYTETGDADFHLKDLAAELGRTAPFICRAAKSLGLTKQSRAMPTKTLIRANAARTAENTYSRTKRGKRPDLGEVYFRSSWEANYARYLNWLMARGEIDSWEFEPETFWFEKIKRGVRSYLPDFRVHEKGSVYFVEIKGWMDSRSKTKLNRMRIYHPKVEVRLVDAKQYRAMSAQLRRLIPNWEGA